MASGHPSISLGHFLAQLKNVGVCYLQFLPCLLNSFQLGYCSHSIILPKLFLSKIILHFLKLLYPSTWTRSHTCSHVPHEDNGATVFAWCVCVRVRVCVCLHICANHLPVLELSLSVPPN
jgi:hypothetical protein